MQRATGINTGDHVTHTHAHSKGESCLRRSFDVLHLVCGALLLALANTGLQLPDALAEQMRNLLR